MRKYLGVFVSLASALLLAGCGSGINQDVSQFSSTTLCVHKDGKLESVIIEDFSQDNYDVDELTNMIDEEVSEYNSECGSENIALKYIDVTGSICTIQMSFNDYTDYSTFQNEALFVGTVKEALENGYDLNVNLVNPNKADDVITLDGITNLSEKKIVICEHATRIRTEGKILYTNEGSKVISNYEIDGYLNTDNTIVIF